MPTSPTQLSLKHLRKAGYLAEVVEKRIPKVFVLKDLFGIIDILAVRKDEILGVQATSYENASHRIKKIAEHENTAAVRESGMRLEIHGWRKVKNRWTPRIVDVS